MKNRLFASLKRTLTAALLLCAVGAAQAQSVSIKIDGSTEPYTGATMEEAILSSGLDYNEVVNVEILSSDAQTFCYEWRSLTTISAPTVTHIPVSSFNGCYSLAFASFPRVTQIDYSTFRRASKLQYMQLGATPPQVSRDANGDAAFVGCTSPRYIELVAEDGTPLTGDALAEAIAAYKAVDDGNASDTLWYGWSIIEKPGSMGVKVNGGADTYTVSTLSAAVAASGIPMYSVTSIEVVSGDMRDYDYAYMRGLSALETFTTNANIALLESFYHPTLREFNGTNIAAVGDYAFERNKFVSVNLPAAITIGKGAFASCSGLTYISLPAATSIGETAFSDCERIDSASLPSVTSIGFEAFAHCIYMSILQLGATPPTCDGRAFADTVAPRFLTLVDANGAPLTDDALLAAVAAYRAANDGITDDNLWFGWRIHEQPKPLVIKLNGGDETFTGESMKAAIATSGLEPGSITAMVVVSGDMLANDWLYLWSDVTALEELSMDKSSDFLSRLTSLRVYNGGALTDVVSYAFHGSGITNVSLPFVTSIGDGAFKDCAALDSMQLGAAPPTVGQNAFDGCPSPRYLTLVDANGTPLAGDAFSAALAAYTAANGSKSAEWYGWTIVIPTNDGAGSSNNQTGLPNTKFESLSAYPNPTRGAVQVEATGEVLLYNAASQLLQRIPAHGKVLIDLSNYPAGMYFIRVGNAVAKVVKK